MKGTEAIVKEAIDVLAMKYMGEFDKENDVLYDAEKNLFYIYQHYMFAILEKHRIENNLDIPDRNTLKYCFKENVEQGNGLIVGMDRPTKINGRCTRCIVLDLNKINDYIKIDLLSVISKPQGEENE